MNRLAADWGGGGRGGEGTTPLDLLSQTNLNCEWILFSLDSVVLIVVCCAAVGPLCVRIVRKRLVSQTSCSIVK